MSTDQRPPIDKSQYREILGACVDEIANPVDRPSPKDRPNPKPVSTPSMVRPEPSAPSASKTSQSFTRNFQLTTWMVVLGCVTFASVVLTLLTGSSNKGVLTRNAANAELLNRYGSSYSQVQAMEGFLNKEDISGIGDPKLADATRRLNEGMGIAQDSPDAIQSHLFQERNGALVYIEGGDKQ